VLWALAAILFGKRIRAGSLLRRPAEPCAATVTACQRGGRTLRLDAPCDGYSPGLEVRLAWWADPEILLPGEDVTFYGRPGGVGKVLVSSSARGRAFVGTGRRGPAPPADQQILLLAPGQRADQQASQRRVRWGTLVLTSLGFVMAVVATLITAVPSLTGHVTQGQLRAGDCVTGPNLGLDSSSIPWPYMVTVVPCTKMHLAEVFFSGNFWTRNSRFPGYNTISSDGYGQCLTAFDAYATGNSSSVSTIYYLVPYDDWGSGDRQLVCMAYEPGVPVDFSIRERGA